MHDNPLQIAQNLGKSLRKCTVTRVVTLSRYGNVLHYGLSMFLELGNVWKIFQK